MANALEQELMQYIHQLDEAEKKSILQTLKTFVKGRGSKADRVSIEEYNQELQEAEAEFEKGEYTSHEEFVKQIRNGSERVRGSLDEAVTEANEASI